MTDANPSPALEAGQTAHSAYCEAIGITPCWDSPSHIVRRAAWAAVEAALAPAPASPAVHPDDEAVDRFAAAMKEKLRYSREVKGRGGWDNTDECSREHLSDLLRNHVEKGDPLDVGNLAMMLHQRGERLATPPAPATDEEVEEMVDALNLLFDTGVCPSRSVKAAADLLTRVAQMRDDLYGMWQIAAKDRDAAEQRAEAAEACLWSIAHDHTSKQGLKKRAARFLAGRTPRVIAILAHKLKEAETQRDEARAEIERLREAIGQGFTRLADETYARLERERYVPGAWRCPKCEFRLVQANLNALDGTVTARDEPGDACPNCNSPLWRVAWKDEAKEAMALVNDLYDRAQNAGKERDELRRCVEVIADGEGDPQEIAQQTLDLLSKETGR